MTNVYDESTPQGRRKYNKVMTPAQRQESFNVTPNKIKTSSTTIKLKKSRKTLPKKVLIAALNSDKLADPSFMNDQFIYSVARQQPTKIEIRKKKEA